MQSRTCCQTESVTSFEPPTVSVSVPVRVAPVVLAATVKESEEPFDPDVVFGVIQPEWPVTLQFADDFTTMISVLPEAGEKTMLSL